MSRRITVLELRSVRGTGGGPEKTILLGAAQSRTDEFQVIVCYIRDARDRIFALDRRAEETGVEYLEVIERHSFDPGVWRQLRRIVQRHRVEIVHAHEYKTDLLAALLARFAGVIPLATVHGWTGQSARERHLYYPADKRVLRRFPRVIAVSSDIRRELIARGTPADRVTLLLNAIDPTAFRRYPARQDAARAALHFEPDDVVIGAVGRLERQKRFDVLLKACAPLLHARPGLRLAIAGDGSLRPELTALIARLDLGRQCRLLGHLDDVVAFHHALDLFVQSSEYEGTPNAVLEAMAMETPIVATDAGGTAELVTDGVEAIVVPPGDISQLRQGVTRALADPVVAAARAAAARRRVETDLSFAARTRRLERVYRDLVGESDGRNALHEVPGHA